MEEIILNGISNNPYYTKKQEKIKAKHLEMKRALSASIKKLDTLSDIFNDVLVENSKKSIIASPNPIFEKERKSDLKDIKWVFDDFTKLNNEITFVNVKLSYIDKPISVISGFSSRGIKEPRMYKVIYSALFGFLLGVLILLSKNTLLYINKVEKDYI